MKSFTVSDAFTKYLEIAPINAKPMLTSIFVRFLVPYWGGEEPKGNRATPFEILAAKEYLNTLPVKLLIDSLEQLEKLFETKNVSKQNRKSFRSIYKAFFKWCKENNYLTIKQELVQNSKAELFQTKNKHKTNYHGQVLAEPYTLMCTRRGGNLIYKDDYINNTLKLELEKFQKFRSDNDCSAATIERDILTIKRILGWLHRYKNIPLELLSLTSIISHQKLSVNFGDCLNDKGKLDMNEVLLQKAIVRQKAVELSKANRKLIEEYLEFIGGHPSTKVLVVGTSINIAKFIYRNDLDDDDFIDESDFPIVRRLNQLSNNLNKIANNTPPSVPHSAKSVPWELVYPLLDKLKEKACTDSYTYIINNKKCLIKRQKSAVFNDLQDFLSMGFMVLIPPDRSRSFYDLEIGRTLVNGIYENDRFTPIDKLPDKNIAKWYMHLESRDYKTGKAYGKFWGEIPNCQFSDGTFFYDYIEKWISEGREYGKKCNHNYFFRGHKDYKKLNEDDWGGRIKKLFWAETGMPVTPKELRKMYITYLKDQGASEAELEAAACWQKHSRLMQSKVYDQQSKANKMAPIQDFNRRTFEKHQQNKDIE